MISKEQIECVLSVVKEQVVTSEPQLIYILIGGFSGIAIGLCIGTLGILFYDKYIKS